MRNQVYNAFDSVRAENNLKEKTMNSVLEKMNKKHRGNVLPKLALAACCLLMLCVGSVGGYDLYFTEVAAISIDVNPSVELSLNRFDRVVGQRAFNEEGQQVLDGLDLKNKTYAEAVELILSSNNALPFIKEDGVVSVTIEAREGEAEQQLLSGIQGCVGQALQEHHGTVQAEFGCADETMREQAHSQGLSVGKYRAIQELMQEDPNATVDEFKDQPMQTIRTHMESCHHQSQQQEQAPEVTAPVQNSTGTGCEPVNNGHHGKSRHHGE